MSRNSQCESCIHTQSDSIIVTRNIRTGMISKAPYKTCDHKHIPLNNIIAQHCSAHKALPEFIIN